MPGGPPPRQLRAWRAWGAAAATVAAAAIAHTSGAAGTPGEALGASILIDERVLPTNSALQAHDVSLQAHVCAPNDMRP